MAEGTTDDSDIHGWRTTNHTKLHEREKQGGAQGTCASASEPDLLTSKLADSPVSESLTRSASGPASLPATSYSLRATAPEAPTPATSYSLPATAPKALFFFL